MVWLHELLLHAAISSIGAVIGFGWFRKALEIKTVWGAVGYIATGCFLGVIATETFSDKFGMNHMFVAGSIGLLGGAALKQGFEFARSVFTSDLAKDIIKSWLMRR